MYAGMYTFARPSPRSIYISKLDLIHIHNFRLQAHSEKKTPFFFGISMVNSQLNILDLEYAMCLLFFSRSYLFNAKWEKLSIHTKLIKRCKIAFDVLLHDVEYYLSLFIFTAPNSQKWLTIFPSSFITFKSISFANNSIPLKASHSLHSLVAVLCKNRELKLALCLLVWIWLSRFLFAIHCYNWIECTEWRIGFKLGFFFGIMWF